MNISDVQEPRLRFYTKFSSENLPTADISAAFSLAAEKSKTSTSEVAEVFDGPFQVATFRYGFVYWISPILKSEGIVPDEYRERSRKCQAENHGVCKGFWSRYPDSSGDCECSCHANKKGTI